MSVLAIYGASGLGREILELAKAINNEHKKWKEILFIDDSLKKNEVENCPVLKYSDAKDEYGSDLQIVMAIGEPEVRKKLFLKIKEDKIPTPTLIHPSVHIPKSTKIGKGVVIQANCFVSVGVTIKDYVFLQANCAIGHDCILEEGCIISSFDSIAGAVKIGQYTYIGMSVAIKELVSVGDYSIIGMGSMVLRNIPNEVIAMGNPARPMKKNEEHKVFKH